MDFRLPLATLLACALAACTAKPKVDEAAVFGALRENLQAMEREDIDAVMATIHPGTPNAAASRALIAESFAKYDLKYDLRELKVVSVTKDEVQVQYVMATTRVSGPDDFQDNLLEGIHTLKKDGDHWKLVRSAIISSTLL